MEPYLFAALAFVAGWLARGLWEYLEERYGEEDTVTMAAGAVQYAADVEILAGVDPFFRWHAERARGNAREALERLDEELNGEG